MKMQTQHALWVSENVENNWPADVAELVLVIASVFLQMVVLHWIALALVVRL